MKYSKRIPKGGTFAVLETLFKVMEKYNKNYCTPSQKHLLRLLKRYHQCDIARSTLNLWLNYLADEHWIKRYRRHYKNDKGQTQWRSTAYYLQQKALNYLNSLVNWAKKALRLSRVRFYGQHRCKTNTILSSLSSFNAFNSPLEVKGGRFAPSNTS